MKIQEMRVSIPRPDKRLENEDRENVFQSGPAGEPIVMPGTDRAMPLEPASELDQPLWAVISFDQMEAGGLIYSDAVAIMSELDSRGVTGLCIVTEAAAKRVRA